MVVTMASEANVSIQAEERPGRINDIIIAGVGGQGVILVSAILARTFLLAGFEVKQAEIHGMSQRGGSVESFVRRGERVYSPLVRRGRVDALLSLEASETLRWLDYLRPGGLVVSSQETIIPVTVTQGISRYPQAIAEEVGRRTDRFHFVDALELARRAGHPRTANVALLGVFARHFELERTLWEEVVAQSVPPGVKEVNLRAFGLGWRLAEDAAVALA